jgi:hypothetical protein
LSFLVSPFLSTPHGMDGRIVDIAYEECAKNKEGAKEDE